MWNIVTRAFEFGFIRTSGELPNEENTWSVKITCWRFRSNTFIRGNETSQGVFFVRESNKLSFASYWEPHERYSTRLQWNGTFVSAWYVALNRRNHQLLRAYNACFRTSFDKNTIILKLPQESKTLKQSISDPGCRPKLWLSATLHIHPKPKNIPYFCRQIKVCWSKQQSSKSRYSSFEK